MTGFLLNVTLSSAETYKGRENTMEQKIVFFDIDGTLYERRNPLGVPESTREAIRRLQEKGNLAFICTGRTRAEMEDWWSELGFDGMICGCGTYISYKGEVVHERKMDLETVEKIVEISEKHGAMPVVEGLDKVYFDDSTFRGTNSSLNELYANYLADFKEHAQRFAEYPGKKFRKLPFVFLI